MSGITFQDRKDKKPLDASFTLFNGEGIGDTSKYSIGDTVGVCFDNQKDKQDAIRQHGPREVKSVGDSGFIMVRCIVVKRHHSIVWQSIGRFRELISCSVVLEAESGFWEDVLKWIVIGTSPDWIPNDEETADID